MSATRYPGGTSKFGKIALFTRMSVRLFGLSTKRGIHAKWSVLRIFCEAPMPLRLASSRNITLNLNQSHRGPVKIHSFPYKIAPLNEISGAIL